MIQVTFGNILTLVFAIFIMRHAWGNPGIVVMGACIIVITIIDVIYRHSQFKRHLKKQDLEDLKKKIEELILSVDEFKRINEATINQINQQL